MDFLIKVNKNNQGELFDAKNQKLSDLEYVSDMMQIGNTIMIDEGKIYIISDRYMYKEDDALYYELLNYEIVADYDVFTLDSSNN